MEILLGSLAGIPMATSVWLMLSRNLVKFLLGLVLIGNVANLVIFASGGLTYGAPPLIAEGVTAPAEPVANPLPQALILTAFVIGCGLAGTLNMADLHGRLGHLEDQELLSAVAVVFLIAFGIKAAVFPLFFWLPASYHTPPIAVSAIFAGLITKI
jgi:multicomponent Na+:H+ antiporter subunit D